MSMVQAWKRQIADYSHILKHRRHNKKETRLENLETLDFIQQKSRVLVVGTDLVDENVVVYDSYETGNQFKTKSKTKKSFWGKLFLSGAKRATTFFDWVVDEEETQKRAANFLVEPNGLQPLSHVIKINSP
ncbi:hypothetical protein L1987_17557 [Smallanthus sonchifolius]|uniref:Uncharacterized protein n=1 Tax=Smallanthus sonchifolius TaxID=185202 RepID=A0ACB9IZ94_9ASTR|nr:hypothetical protein L1987_17557 [Smallanthus sonchifolius]